MGDQGNTDSPRKYEVINETNTARYSLFWDLNQLRSRGTFVPWKPPNQDKIVINEDVYKQLCTLNENKSPGPDNS